MGCIIVAFSIFFTVLFYLSTKGDEYIVNNAVYTGEVFPAENVIGMVLVTFKDENGNDLRLFLSEEKINLFEKGSYYNVRYLMNTASYPNDNILSDWNVSSAKSVSRDN